MSIKIFKNSTKVKRDGLDFEAFSKKYSLNEFDNEPVISRNESYDIDWNPPNIRSKDFGKVSYSDVCPDAPPYISGLVIGIMEEIEKRIPPLTNITHGYFDMTSKCDALLDIAIENCKSPDTLPFTLFEESTATLFQILQLFLDRLETPIFCADVNLTSKELLYTYQIKYGFSNSLPNIMHYLEVSLGKMRREQVAMTSYIIQKLQSWCLMNVEYQLEKNHNLNKDNIFLESINFFRIMLGSFVVGFPMEYVHLMEYRQFRSRNQLKFSNSSEEIFAIILSNVNYEYWHNKTIELFSSPSSNFAKTSVFNQIRKKSKKFLWI